jgi:hypothetical protein
MTYLYTPKTLPAFHFSSHFVSFVLPGLFHIAPLSVHLISHATNHHTHLHHLLSLCTSHIREPQDVKSKLTVYMLEHSSNCNLPSSTLFRHTTANIALQTTSSSSSLPFYFQTPPPSFQLFNRQFLDSHVEQEDVFPTVKCTAARLIRVGSRLLKESMSLAILLKS